MRHGHRFGRILLVAMALCAVSFAGQEPAAFWGPFFEELRIQQLQLELSQRHKPRTVAFVGVSVVPMPTPGTLDAQTVVVRDGLIDQIGPASSVAVPDDALRVDGRGKFLMPGLTDMHVHTLERSAHMLLELANGVTSVREMCGFPWLLAQRAQVREDRLLAPNMYVAGPLLNYFPMGMYTAVVLTPEAGRKAVLEHKRAGYDFIKVHNVLPREIYRAVLDTAREEHIRVVGHIPHDILVAEAVAGGQRTFEHFKGYFLDATLELSTEDWVAATKDADVWNCPTLYVRRNAYAAEEVRALERSDEARYVSTRDLRSRVAASTPEGDAGPRKVFEMSKEIFRKLIPIGARFLAGTDSGSYRNTVPGFALLEELSLMQDLGLPMFDVLRSATANAAEAMERTAEFGTVEKGKRADLVLCNGDPLKGVESLRKPTGVMVRGIWLGRADLDDLLGRIESTYRTAAADATLDAPSDQQIERLVGDMAGMVAAGWVFKDHQLDALASLLRERRRDADAKRVAEWRTARGG